MSDSKVEQVARKLGIPWPSAEEDQLRQAATAFDAAAKAVDAQRQVCTAKVRSVTASNTGGGLDQFASFWGRYDGSGAGGGAMPATATALRDTASALRQFADEVQKTKDSIRHKVEIAGAALVVGAVAAVFTLGASEAAAVAAAAVIADFAAAAGVALSATVATIIGTALVGAAFGAVESIAIDALVVQPMSVALGEQKGFSFHELATSGEFGAAGGFLGGGAGGALSRLPALSGSVAGNFPRLAGTLDGLTTFTGSTGGRLATNGLIGAGSVEALSGGKANGFDVLSGLLGGMASPTGRQRLLGKGTHSDGTWSGEGLSLSRSDNQVATKSLAAAQAHEPRITADMQSVARDVPSAGLAGLSFRIKGADSFRRKVATEIGDGSTATKATTGIRDTIRYTLKLPPQDYAAGVTAASRAMTERGYEPVPGKFKVSWDSPDYRGINSSWRDPRTGQVFELQFHTPDSLAAKESTHALYEEQRLPGTSPERQAELQRLQREIFSKVPVPPGAADIPAPPTRVTP